MAQIKTTYKSAYVRPKIHHYSSVAKLKKKTVKFADNEKDSERLSKCLAQKYEKIPETIDLYPFVKICSFEQICPNEKTTYQIDYPDENPIVSHRHEKEETEQNTHPCRFLYDPNRYPRIASDITHSKNSTKRIPKNHYPRVYTDVTQQNSTDKKLSKKIVTISRHIFDRTKKSDISDALPGGKCIASASEYKDGIGSFKGVLQEKKTDPHFKNTVTRLCKQSDDTNEC